MSGGTSTTPGDPAAAFRLDGRVAVITGASRGIGEAIARVYAAAGSAALVLNARHSEDLEDLAAHLRSGGTEVVVVPGSIGDEATIETLVETAGDRFGGVDIIVNNAGTNPTFGALVDTDGSAVRKVLEVNVEGPLGLVRTAWHAGMGERGGAVVNIASIGGISPMIGIGAYNASKAALLHLTRQLALECAPQVRVNAIAPGLIRTRFARALWEPDEDAAAALIPLGRIGEPVDVAQAAVFLASDAAAWITGSILTVDGGQLLA